MTHAAPLTKTIWILWLQGMARAPYVVRKCCESWLNRNSGWNVVFLDADVLAKLRADGSLIPEFDGLSYQQTSDLVRLSLLAQYGGVWADATCFCVSPLDDWLETKLDTGFFAFARPGSDRILSSWFIAAQQDNQLIMRVYDFMRSYWTDRPIRRDHADPIVRVLTRLLRPVPQTRGLWFSRLIRDGLGGSPYFALHYGFEKVIRDNLECRRIWRGTPKVSADGPHKLLSAGLMSVATDEIRTEIDSGATPIYKTTWKIDSIIPSDSVLGYLLNTCTLAVCPRSHGINYGRLVTWSIIRYEGHESRDLAHAAWSPGVPAAGLGRRLRGDYLWRGSVGRQYPGAMLVAG